MLATKSCFTEYSRADFFSALVSPPCAGPEKSWKNLRNDVRWTGVDDTYFSAAVSLYNGRPPKVHTIVTIDVVSKTNSIASTTVPCRLLLSFSSLPVTPFRGSCPTRELHPQRKLPGAPLIQSHLDMFSSPSSTMASQLLPSPSSSLPTAVTTPDSECLDEKGPSCETARRVKKIVQDVKLAESPLYFRIVPHTQSGLCTGG